MNTEKSLAVVDDHGFSLHDQVHGEGDPPPVGGCHRSTCGSSNVQTGMTVGSGGIVDIPGFAEFSG